MNTFTLRTCVQPCDRPAIASLLDAVGVFRPEEVAVGLELLDETLSRDPRSTYRWFLADCEDASGSTGKLLGGFACFGPVSLTDATFDLYWIAVDPSLRGLGIADALDDAVTDAVCREAGRWILAETSSTPPYEPARRFYIRRGYTLLESIPDFYRRGDDRLTYGKRLEQPG
jgi:ribosomal protein S18 acetylase RimI-like enzyme